MEKAKIIMSIIFFILLLIFIITEFININLYRQVKNKEKYKEIKKEAKTKAISKLLYICIIAMVVLLAIYSLGGIVLSTLTSLNTNYSQVMFYVRIATFAENYFKYFDLFICAAYLTADLVLLRAIYMNKEKKFDLSIMGKERTKINDDNKKDE